MPLQLEHLDDVTRPFMVAELDRDGGPPDRVHISARLSVDGQDQYRDLLRAALTSGGTGSFEDDLSRPGILNRTELRRGRPITMAANAAQLLAEGEFNRYYIRGTCARVLDSGDTHVQVYRARHSWSPRSASQRLIGRWLDAALLLDDLRLHIGEEPTLLPLINSGLSVRIA
jgi:hypothetical protein